MDTAARTNRLQVAGISTAVRISGDGPPVVLLHRQGGFGGLWLPVIGDLVRTHHVIAPDLPGLGESVVLAGPPGTDTVLAWLDELVDQTCGAQPLLVGFSLGGQIAARYAARHRDRLAGLVLLDTPGLVGRVRPAPATLLALLRHQARPSERSMLRLLRHLTFDPERLREQLGDRWEWFLGYQVDRARCPSVQQANRRLMREIGLRRIPPSVLAAITAPTTLIWGRQDKVTPLRTAEQTSARYGWPLHVLDHAGHLSIVEQPRATLTVLSTALNRSAT
jgi:pimeloyl-ACP methyl ester carboxylesterase